MYIKAVLHVEGKRFNVLEFRHWYTQPSNDVGKPIGNMKGGFWDITIESTRNTVFTEWAAHPTMMKNVKIVVEPANYGKSYTFELYDVFCVSNKTSFHHSNTQPILNQLVFSPAQIAINGKMEFKKLWKITDLTETAIPTSIVEEENEQEETREFEITIKQLKVKKTFVPLGIPAYKGTPENKSLDFEIEVKKNEIEHYKIEILQDNNVIFTANSGANGLPETYGVGKHTFKWDGFNSNGIYDSKSFLDTKLQAKITGSLDGNDKTAESDKISFKRKEVDWVDTIINKNNKRIDVTLRVNLRDGGEKGTAKDCHAAGSGSYSPERRVCPWDDIPESVIKDNLQEPIKIRTKTFKELRKIALEGVSTYWSRTLKRTKGTEIDGVNYEINVNAIQDKKGMKAPKIIYFTNSKETNFTRSHN